MVEEILIGSIMQNQKNFIVKKQKLDFSNWLPQKKI